MVSNPNMAIFQLVILLCAKTAVNHVMLTTLQRIVAAMAPKLDMDSFHLMQQHFISKLVGGAMEDTKTYSSWGKQLACL